MIAKRMLGASALCALGVVLGGLVVGINAQGTPQPPAGPAKVDAPVDDRPADRTAIREAMKRFVAAFEKGDAAAAAAHMTTGAELMAPDGTTVYGRDAIQKAYAAHFAKYPQHQVRVEPESLRFTSRDTAIEEGHMSVTRGKESPGFYRYVVLHVREGGNWLMGVLRNDESEQASLRDLEWLIGTWVAKGPGAEARTTYEWSGNKAFIRAQFAVQEGGVALAGTQMIGLDPATGGLRVWTFEADGSYGEGTVTRDGDKWLFASDATLADGRRMSAVNALTPMGRDAFVWHPMDITVDDEPVGNASPIRVVRVKP